MASRTIFLIGARGTGKSTVARLLAVKLGRSWIDADQHLEAKQQTTIREIFEREGESAFRAKESAALIELIDAKIGVIATGGGVILRPENRAWLRASGFVVWLQAEPQTIWERIQHDPTSAASRPPLTDMGGLDEIRVVLAEREPLYRACADLAIDTVGRSPEDVVDEILRRLDRS